MPHVLPLDPQKLALRAVEYPLTLPTRSYSLVTASMGAPGDDAPYRLLSQARLEASRTGRVLSKPLAFSQRPACEQGDRLAAKALRLRTAASSAFTL